MNSDITFLVTHEVNPFVYWKVVSIKEMTKDELMRIQKDYGYHPNGYGFESLDYDLDVTLGSPRYVYRWKCYNICD